MQSRDCDAQPALLPGRRHLLASFSFLLGHLGKLLPYLQAQSRSARGVHAPRGLLSQEDRGLWLNAHWKPVSCVSLRSWLGEPVGVRGKPSFMHCSGPLHLHPVLPGITHNQVPVVSLFWGTPKRRQSPWGFVLGPPPRKRTGATITHNRVLEMEGGWWKLGE